MLADMAGFLDILRSGDWLTLSRARLWALAVLIASAGGLVYLVATSDGLIDYQGRPLGTDFSNVYAAGTYVLDGKPAAPFDPRLQHARAEGDLRRRDTISTAGTIRRSSCSSRRALALMPYLLALIVWQGATLALYLWRLARSRAHRRESPIGLATAGPPAARLLARGRA